MHLREQPDRLTGRWTQEGAASRKGRSMNPQIQVEEQRTRGILKKDKLAECGFTAEERAALLWLRAWYQSGGSDRVQLVRHWELLKLLVMTGKLEV